MDIVSSARMPSKKKNRKKSSIQLEKIRLYAACFIEMLAEMGMLAVSAAFHRYELEHGLKSQSVAEPPRILPVADKFLPEHLWVSAVVFHIPYRFLLRDRA